MTRLEEGSSMWERRRKWWSAQSSREKFNLVLPLCKLYLCDPLIFLKFNFDTKVYFYYFTVSGLREEREISLDFDTKKESHRSSHFQPPKWMFLMFTSFIR